jgi:hypothetical protein
MNFLPLTEPNPTDSLGEVKVLQQVRAEKCHYNDDEDNDDDDNSKNLDTEIPPIYFWLHIHFLSLQSLQSL